MNRYAQYAIAFIAITLIAILTLSIIHRITVKQNAETTAWYYDGEVLYPDYVHDDTLVVIRANYLNKIVNSKGFDDSDGAISEALVECTIPLKGRVLDLPEEYLLNNKLDDLSTLITKDSIIIGFQ